MLVKRCVQQNVTSRVEGNGLCDTRQLNSQGTHSNESDLIMGYFITYQKYDCIGYYLWRKFTYLHAHNINFHKKEKRRTLYKAAANV
jgi:hypothetical protein